MADRCVDQKPVRLLSLDGGGVRGLSELVLLQHIMDGANNEREKMGLKRQEPWEMFDMIGGTSTGGLIAVMLGRLRMSLEDCKKAYMELSEKSFTKKNLLKRAKAKMTVGPKFETQPLEDSIKSIIGNGSETLLLKDKRTLLEDENRGCLVFVLAHLQNPSQLSLLRSYQGARSARSSFDHLCVWQACRATTAAPTFFDSIKVGGYEYSDGGVIRNNPVNQVWAEANFKFPNRPKLLISLGSGKAKLQNFESSLRTIAKELVRLTTETETIEDEFFVLHSRASGSLRGYYRFSVESLGDFSLDEAEKLHEINNSTEYYLNRGRVGEEMEMCYKQLSEGAQDLTEVMLPYPESALPNIEDLYDEQHLQDRFAKLKQS